jgi:hypothetical protein
MNGMSRVLASSLLALALVSGSARRSRADVTYTLADHGSGNAASVTFSSVAGGIEVSVTNTEANTGDIANGISQVQFTLNPSTVGQASGFTELSGSKISYSGKGAGTVTGPFDYNPVSNDPDLHWSLVKTASGTTSLVNVSGGGLTGPGGQPVELIVALNSIATANSPAEHSPSFNGTASFFLADSSVPVNLTASDITGVKFSFGTGPEAVLTTTSLSVPEPPSLIISGTGAWIGLMLAIRHWRRRRVDA